MLHYSTIKPESTSRTKQLIQLRDLDNFYLVGDTALALFYGHRLSVDLDLFSTTLFSNEDIIRALEKNVKGFQYRSATNPIGLFCMIEDLKVDFC